MRYVPQEETMIRDNKWWYLMIRDFEQQLFLRSKYALLSAEERLELRLMLQDVLRLVDDLARKR